MSLILGGWSVATYGGFVDPLFVPSPSAIVAAIGEMHQQGTLFTDIWVSTYVVVTGFVIAAAVAIPIGILMGTFASIEAALEPPVGFIRYLPVTALVPLFILLIGIGDVSKISIIFYGTFFQLVLMVADVAAMVKKEMLHTAYTLGIRKRQVVRKVLLPATMPGIVDNLRITMGWAWTYLVVAELLAANSGLGYMILQSLRGLRTDRIYAGILLIGLLGIIFDRIFRILHSSLFPWSERAGG
ncbi:MAG: ABC transporter permease [Actinomycetota bacterium]|nr:ABC transporter permease [Actinomycetota bacterium]